MTKTALLLLTLCLFFGCTSQEQVRKYVREETAGMKIEIEEYLRVANQKQYTGLVEGLEAVKARLNTLREVEVRLTALEGLVRKNAHTQEESIGLSGAGRITLKERLVQMEGRLSVLEGELSAFQQLLKEIRKEGGEPSELLRTEVAGLTSKVKELEKFSGVATMEVTDREMANLRSRVEDLQKHLDLQMSEWLKSFIDLKNFVIDKTTFLEAEMKTKFQLMEKTQKEKEEGKAILKKM